MGKVYFLDTDVWTETSYHELLADEFRVFLFLRHPPDCSLTGLEELSVWSIARFCCMQPDRVADIVTVLSSKMDVDNKPLVVHDNGLYFIASAAREKIKSAPRFMSRLIASRNKYARHKSQFGSEMNRAYAAFLSYWEQEFFEQDYSPNGALMHVTNPLE